MEAVDDKNFDAWKHAVMFDSPSALDKAYTFVHETEQVLLSTQKLNDTPFELKDLN